MADGLIVNILLALQQDSTMNPVIQLYDLMKTPKG